MTISTKTFRMSYSYSGPKSNTAGDEAFAHLGAIEGYLQTAYAEAGVSLDHEYSWADGSVYKKITTEMSIDELKVISDRICASCPIAGMSVVESESYIAVH